MAADTCTTQGNGSTTLRQEGRIMRQVLARVGPIVLIGVLLLIGGIAVVPGPIASGLTEWTADRLTPILMIGAGQILGGVLILIGLYFWYATASTERQTHTLVDTWIPEQPRNPPAIIGENMNTRIDTAADDITIKGVPYEETEPRELLQSVVKQAIAQADTQDAETQLKSGTWTDDPVAGAFLGDEQTYPPRFQLYRWARPEQAYRQAIQRTVSAIDRQYNPDGADPTDATAQSESWFRLAKYRSAKTAHTDNDSKTSEQPPQRSTMEANDD